MLKSIVKSGKLTLIWVFLISIISLPLLLLGMNDIITHLGVIPRDVSDLWSVLTSPFVHGSLAHYLSNITAIIVLLYLAYVTYKKNFISIVIIELIVVSGLITWLIGRHASHLGASGLIFALISFLIFAGIYSRKAINIIVSIIVAFVYGSTVLIGILPTDSGVSWEGHLSGFVAGIMIALVNKSFIKKKKITQEFV